MLPPQTHLAVAAIAALVAPMLAPAAPVDAEASAFVWRRRVGASTEWRASSAYVATVRGSLAAPFVSNRQRADGLAAINAVLRLAHPAPQPLPGSAGAYGSGYSAVYGNHAVSVGLATATYSLGPDVDAIVDPSILPGSTHSVSLSLSVRNDLAITIAGPERVVRQ